MHLNYGCIEILTVSNSIFTSVIHAQCLSGSAVCVRARLRLGRLDGREVSAKENVAVKEEQGYIQQNALLFGDTFDAGEITC